ncbi:MAG: hypothetical protein LBS36_11785 [Oscillospiraceae bacterium]|jgi:hypothetical protein|nr:hypothetical protein [Oscillospiraceae bacterium]
MKKTCLLMLVLAVLFGTAIPALAAEMPSGTGDDVADLTASLDTYFSDYLPGLKTESRNAIKKSVKTGLQNNKDKYFMPMMSTLANIRKAGQAGEGEGVKDVINQYYKLSDKAKTNAVNYLSSALKGVFLTVNFSNGVMTVS